MYLGKGSPVCSKRGVGNLLCTERRHVSSAHPGSRAKIRVQRLSLSTRVLTLHLVDATGVWGDSDWPIPSTHDARRTMHDAGCPGLYGCPGSGGGWCLPLAFYPFLDGILGPLEAG